MGTTASLISQHYFSVAMNNTLTSLTPKQKAAYALESSRGFRQSLLSPRSLLIAVFSLSLVWLLRRWLEIPIEASCLSIALWLLLLIALAWKESSETAHRFIVLESILTSSYTLEEGLLGPVAISHPRFAYVSASGHRLHEDMDRTSIQLSKTEAARLRKLTTKETTFEIEDL